MAITTRTKRISMMHLFGGYCSLPVPDGTISVSDRALLLYLYSGLMVSSGSTGQVIFTPVRYVTDGTTANVVPVETVPVMAAGVVPVREMAAGAGVVPVREADTETPRVKVCQV